MSKVWYGSLQNRIAERAVKGQPEPTVGMGATLLSYSDRHGATIVSVEKQKNGRFIIEVQQDHAKRIDKNGMSECQDYEFTPNPTANKLKFRQAENGMWERIIFNEKTKRFNKYDSGGLRIGDRDEYYDFSF